MELLTRLAKRFPPNEVRQRTQGGKKLDYISIDMVIGRLNEVLGARWDFTLSQTLLTPLADGQYLASVTGEIKALSKVASGVGSDIAKDPDKAYKTALAECLKKASHQFGVGLYLWDEGERQVVEQVRVATAAGDDLRALKLQVVQLAKGAGIEANGQAMAAYFGVTVEALGRREILEEILAA